jgi:uncharacterized membrane protein YkgB
VAFLEAAQPIIRRLQELRLTALQLHVEAELLLGRHREVIPDLMQIVTAHPVHEPFYGQLMLALYRCGRRADALNVYAKASEVLSREMALEPGPDLRRLRSAISSDDHYTLCRARLRTGSKFAPSSQQVRAEFPTSSKWIVVRNWPVTNRHRPRSLAAVMSGPSRTRGGNMTDVSERTTIKAPAERPLEGAYQSLLSWLAQVSLPATRIAIGVVYIWYGCLKIAGVSPAASLVRDMVSVIGSPSWIVPVFGVLEVFIGLWLLTGRRLQYLLPLFVAHMLGTLGVLVLLPDTSYQHHNPLALTFTGEFVTKNFVLLAAGITVMAVTAARQRR